MIKLLQKISFAFVVFYMISLGVSVPSIVSAANKEYLAYTESTDSGSAFFVEDNGKKVVYCYNQPYNQPNSQWASEDKKTYYSREESYLSTKDDLMDQYGKEKKEKIATVLKYGYPLNTTGLMEQCYVDEESARYVTQQLIWAICAGDYAPLEETEWKWIYYNKLLELAKTDKFQQVSLNLVGNLKFVDRGGYYSTDRLIIDSKDNVEGTTTIINLPSTMSIKNWNTGEVLDGKSIGFRTEFYIESKTKPDPSFKLSFKYSFNEMKFYFYKYLKGGEVPPPKPSYPYQSLIRAEITDKIIEESFEISTDNTVKPIQTGSVILKKKDSQSNELLQGAVFNLQSSSGVNIKTGLTTDVNGQIKVDNLAPGNYRFIEVEAPNGYILDENPSNFTIVVGQTSPIEVIRFNVTKPVDLKVRKIEKGTGELLKGAEFELFLESNTAEPLKFSYSDVSKKYEVNSGGNSILAVDNSNSSFIIGNLTCNDYIMKETKAPSGYQKCDDIYIHISVKDSYYKVGENGTRIPLSKDKNLNLYQFDVENRKEIVLPDTGEKGVDGFRRISIYLLTIVTVLGLTLLEVEDKKRD